MQRNHKSSVTYTSLHEEKFWIQCITYLMLPLNTLYFLIGGAIIGLSVWIILDRNFTSIMFGNVLMTTGTYLVIAGATIVLVTSFLGCVASLKSNWYLYLAFVILMGIAALILVIGAILAIIFTIGVDIEDTSYMRAALQKDYGVNLENKYNAQLTQAWDQGQEKMRCCGVEDQSWLVYQSSEWYKIQPGLQDVEKPYVPASCCVVDQYGQYFHLQKCQTWRMGPPGISAGLTNPAVHYRGCYEAGREYSKINSSMVAGFGFGLALVLVPSIFCAVVLIIRYKRY